MSAHNAIVIAIDGPAASGKGTLARALAKQLSFAYLDTGALYRAVGFEVLEAGGEPEDEATAVQGAEMLSEKIAKDGPTAMLGNPALRTDNVGQAASKVASIQAVRDLLTDFQRNFAQAPGESYKGAILDGRDIGTVICPTADVKLYVQASMEIRAERRTKELQSKGIEVTKAHVLQDMRERDERDMHRQAAPLKPAQDAIVLDTSDCEPSEVLEKALKIIKASISA